jgi:hypothetical protein
MMGAVMIHPSVSGVSTVSMFVFQVSLMCMSCDAPRSAGELMAARAFEIARAGFAQAFAVCMCVQDAPFDKQLSYNVLWYNLP